MAVLNKIRQRSIFLIIIIALALFSFVLADVIQNGGFTSQKSLSTIATVNGTDISRDDFTRKVDNTLRNLGPEATNAQAMNMVWENELKVVLLEEQYEKLGLTVSAQQVRRAIAQNLATNPTFLNEAGVFDYNKVEEYVADVKVNAPDLYNQFLEFENNLAKTAKEQTYFNMVKAGLTATSAEGMRQYKMENDKADIEFVQIPYTSIPNEDVTITDADISAYVNANPERFKVEPGVDIQYVLFSETPSEEDAAVVRDEINELLSPRIEYNSVTQQNDTIPGFRDTDDNIAFANRYSEGQFGDRWFFKSQLPQEIADTLFAMNIGEIYGPFKMENNYNLSKIVEVRQMADSVQAKHILVSWDGLQTASTTRTKEQAKNLADSLLEVVKRDPMKFETLATEYSDDPSATQNNGDLGYLTSGGTIEEFDNFIFTNKTGDKEVVETEFGYHVIVIADQKNIQKAIKIANVSKSVESSEETLNKIFRDASNFESQVANKDFVEVANENSLMSRPVNRIGELEENIPGIGNNRSIVTWAFEKETNVGDVKRFNINNGYAIVQLTNKNPKGLMSVAEASPIVTPILRNEKKAKMIRDNSKGSTLEEIAQEKNTEVKSASAITMQSPTLPDAGTEPKVVGTAFGLKDGQTSGFIDGRNGVYKVKLLSKTEAPQREDYSTYTSQVTTKRTGNVNRTVFTALKKKADIDDNRASFY